MRLSGPRAGEDVGRPWRDALQEPMDAGVWKSVIPTMTVRWRSLRRTCGTSTRRESHCDEVAPAVAERALRGTHSRGAPRDRQFPFRYLAAHPARAPERWHAALEHALGHSLADVPPLPGRDPDPASTVRLHVQGHRLRRSKLTRADAGPYSAPRGLCGAEQADLVKFGWKHKAVPFEPGEAGAPL
ncbi:hypothetical protein GCM10017687_37850 [Streptomyces echinatus]